MKCPNPKCNKEMMLIDREIGIEHYECECGDRVMRPTRSDTQRNLYTKNDTQRRGNDMS